MGAVRGNQEASSARDNRLRFLAKHGDWLIQTVSRQPRPGRVTLDRPLAQPGRYPRLPRVLIIDNEVPHMARGGGLPRARLMLCALAGDAVSAVVIRRRLGTGCMARFPTRSR